MYQPASSASRFCVAPMLDVTDRHARYFYRSLSKHSLLYTEMITSNAILHGDVRQLLNYNPYEHPLALQLGGSNPQALAQCCILANELGYDEINLNVGCPSNRVQAGRFGACLMAEPELVRDCIAAMQANSRVPITIKCRLGIDDQESFAYLLKFVDTVAAAPCNHFIIHARKAWLKGLNPKQNREIPPLLYAWVYRLKQERPHLKIIINGGITSINACLEHLQYVDGVMLGRAIIHNPALLTQVDARIFEAATPAVSNKEALLNFIPYIEQELQAGALLQHMVRHLVHIFNSTPGARKFRRYLSEHAYKKNAGTEVLLRAIELIDESQDKPQLDQIAYSSA